MRMLTAIIKPAQLDAVMDALNAKGVTGMTVSEVRGHGRQKGHTEIYRGTEYTVDLLPKIKLEIALPEDQVETVIEIVRSQANTGKIGDGKIFVYDLSSVVRIRTGERDSEAIG